MSSSTYNRSNLQTVKFLCLMLMLRQLSNQNKLSFTSNLFNCCSNNYFLLTVSIWEFPFRHKKYGKLWRCFAIAWLFSLTSGALCGGLVYYVVNNADFSGMQYCHMPFMKVIKQLIPFSVGLIIKYNIVQHEISEIKLKLKTPFFFP